MVKKASQQVKRFQNPGGASISTVSRPVFQQDGLYFKDIDGTGALTPVNDWRLPAAQRAAAYVKTLTVKEKSPSCSPRIGAWAPSILRPGSKTITRWQMRAACWTKHR